MAMTKMMKVKAAKKTAPAAACITRSLPRAHGASRSLHFLSCAAVESFGSVSRA
jgi:hypothetical protein